jgi:hypothetical protein
MSEPKRAIQIARDALIGCVDQLAAHGIPSSRADVNSIAIGIQRGLEADGYRVPLSRWLTEELRSQLASPPVSPTTDSGGET